MPAIQKNKIIYDRNDWLGGLHQQYDTSTGVPKRQDNKLAAVRSVTPYRAWGYMQPGFNPTDVTNVSQMTGLGLKGVVEDTDAYIVLANGRVVKLDILTATLATSTGWPHDISGATAGSDIANYSANVSSTLTTCLFVSWYDGTDGDIARLDIGNNTWDDTWFSTTAASGFNLEKDLPIVLQRGKDDILYVLNGNEIHAIDGQQGADGTVSQTVLEVPSDYIFTSAAKTDTYLVGFAYKEQAGGSFNKSQVTAFFWDYLSQDPTLVIDLNDNVCSEAFEWRGTVGCFTGGRRTNPVSNTKSSKVQLYSFESGKFEVLTTFTGNLPIRGGVEVTGDIIQWNSQGKVHQWGTNFDDTDDVLNQTSEGLGTTSGLLAEFSTTTQFISSGTTTSGGLQTLNTGYEDSSFFQGAAGEPIFPTGQKGRVRNVTVTFERGATGGRVVAVSLQDELGNTTNIISAAENLGNTTAIDSSNIVTDRHYTSAGAVLPRFRAISPIVQWSSGGGAGAAPSIASIEIEFEAVNTTL